MASTVFFDSACRPLSMGTLSAHSCGFIVLACSRKGSHVHVRLHGFFVKAPCLDLAHPQLERESSKLKLQADKDFGHSFTDALYRLHFVGGESTTASASAESQKPRTIL